MPTRVIAVIPGDAGGTKNTFPAVLGAEIRASSETCLGVKADWSANVALVTRGMVRHFTKTHRELEESGVTIGAGHLSVVFMSFKE